MPRSHGTPGLLTPAQVERARPSAPRRSATKTAIAYRAICQPTKNHGDPCGE